MFIHFTFLFWALPCCLWKHSSCVQSVNLLQSRPCQMLQNSFRLWNMEFFFPEWRSTFLHNDHRCQNPMFGMNLKSTGCFTASQLIIYTHLSPEPWGNGGWGGGLRLVHSQSSVWLQRHLQKQHELGSRRVTWFGARLTHSKLSSFKILCVCVCVLKQSEAPKENKKNHSAFWLMKEKQWAIITRSFYSDSGCERKEKICHNQSLFVGQFGLKMMMTMMMIIIMPLQKTSQVPGFLCLLLVC